MNATAGYDLTVVIPIYNEKDNLSDLVQSLKGWIPTCRLKTCVLFIDDGSNDGSSDIIAQICSGEDCFHYISFTENKGLSTALKAGFDNVCSALTGYMDADLQQDPNDFNILLEVLGEHAMATGIRKGRQDSCFKKLQSKVGNGFRRIFTSDGAIDTGCPLKILRSEVARKLPLFKGMHRFIPALVLLQNGCDYIQVPVSHRPRMAGKSKFHIWNRLTGPFIDCFVFLWMKKRNCIYNIKSSDLI